MARASARRPKRLVAILLTLVVVLALGGVGFAWARKFARLPNARLLNGSGVSVTAFAFSADSAHLATIGWDGNFRLFETATGKRLQERLLLRLPQNDIALSPDGREFAVATVGFPTARWSIAPNRNAVPKPFWPAVASGYVRYSPNGRLLAASGMRAATVHFWDTATGKSRFVLTGHHGYASGIAFSPDGRFVATVDAVAAHLFDATSGRPIRSWPGIYPTFVAFSPDGTRLAFGGPLSDLRLVNVADTRPGITVREQEIHRAVFTPDSRYLIVARDSDLILYDETGKARRNLVPNAVPPGFLMRMFPPLRKLQRLPVTALAFSPNGRYFAYASADAVLLQPTSALNLPP